MGFTGFAIDHSKESAPWQAIDQLMDLTDDIRIVHQDSMRIWVNIKINSFSGSVSDILTQYS